MGRLLAYLGGNATAVLFGGVFLGLVFPNLAALSRPLLAPAVVAILAASLLRIDWGEMANYGRRPLLTGLLTVWMLVASPLAMWLVLKLFVLPEALETALVLMAAAPPILAAAAFSQLLGLDAALAVVIGLVATLLTPLTLPPLALALLGLELNLAVGAFMARLVAVVLGAFALAAIFRRIAGRPWLEAHQRHIDGFVVVVMLVFAVAIMDGVTEALFQRPRVVALWLAVAFLANPLLQVLGALVFAWTDLRRSLTVGLMTGNCNMGLLLAALPAATDFDIVLFFAVAQIPMYMLPALLRPLYVKLLILRSE